MLLFSPGYFMGMCVAAPEKNLIYVHQVGAVLISIWDSNQTQYMIIFSL